MHQGFNIKLLFLFTENVSRTLFQSDEHLQDTLVTKLLRQFIELHTTQFFKGPKN